MWHRAGPTEGPLSMEEIIQMLMKEGIVPAATK